MKSQELIRRGWIATEALALLGTLAGSALLAQSAEWHPIPLVAVLLGLALLGQWLGVEISGGQLNASLVAIVVAMGVLGPSVAVTCGVAAMVLTSVVRRLPARQWLSNLSTYTLVPFVGAMVIRAWRTTFHQGALSAHDGFTFGLVLFGVVLLTTALSFALFALDVRIDEGRSLRRVASELIALLPGELAVGALATILAVAYTSVGFPALIAAITVLLIFRQLTVALLRSEDRAEQIYARSRQLVGLQLGVLRTLVRALSMRDNTTGRHAAAVALYAKALAAELDCSEEEQDTVHAAGLLHEIGKFTWPDRVLHADVVADEDLPIVRNHPQEGSLLVGALDGYGPVADAILYHHERVDGRGYPAGLIGKEIPLASRILAICSTYDTMTARGGYRSSSGDTSPMSPEEAIEELRNAAKAGQLDGDLVESFIGVLEREGTTFAHDADFEKELNFERRVRDMAEPKLS
ncbi:MAG TPA: HD domain-containing phosphohydrolase [Solirubrobacteraceae bacterium]|jgi:HD-GYP domain-containing protein (c-di-GMP phosphodiesterase class II)